MPGKPSRLEEGASKRGNPGVRPNPGEQRLANVVGGSTHVGVDDVPVTVSNDKIGTWGV